jgi:hypothetical protein
MMCFPVFLLCAIGLVTCGLLLYAFLIKALGLLDTVSTLDTRIEHIFTRLNTLDSLYKKQNKKVK